MLLVCVGQITHFKGKIKQSILLTVLNFGLLKTKNTINYGKDKYVCNHMHGCCMFH